MSKENLSRFQKTSKKVFFSLLAIKLVTLILLRSFRKKSKFKRSFFGKNSAKANFGNNRDNSLVLLQVNLGKKR